MEEAINTRAGQDWPVTPEAYCQHGTRATMRVLAAGKRAAAETRVEVTALETNSQKQATPPDS